MLIQEYHLILKGKVFAQVLHYTISHTLHTYACPMTHAYIYVYLDEYLVSTLLTGFLSAFRFPLSHPVLLLLYNTILRLTLIWCKQLLSISRSSLHLFMCYVSMSVHISSDTVSRNACSYKYK